ncbi:MAG: hypothetical protein QW315_00990 [Candidatus Hadarchaeum sp.]
MNQIVFYGEFEYNAGADNSRPGFRDPLPGKIAELGLSSPAAGRAGQK